MPGNKTFVPPKRQQQRSEREAATSLGHGSRVMAPLPLTPRTRFGEELRTLRRRSRLNLKQVAELFEHEFGRLFHQEDVELSWQALQHWEHGRRLPRTRPILLAVISVLVNRMPSADAQRIDAEAANGLLRLADHRELDAAELSAIFGVSQQPFSLVKVLELARAAQGAQAPLSADDNGQRERLKRRRQSMASSPLESNRVSQRLPRVAKPDVSEYVNRGKPEVARADAPGLDHVIRTTDAKRAAGNERYSATSPLYKRDSLIAVHHLSRAAETVHPDARGVGALAEPVSR